MFYSKRSLTSQGRVAVWLLLWVLILAAAAVVWWQVRRGRETVSTPGSAAFMLRIDSVRPDRLPVRLTLTLPTPAATDEVVLTLPPGATVLSVETETGRPLAHRAPTERASTDRTSTNRVSFTAPGPGPYRVDYVVPLGVRRASTYASAGTPLGGVARVKDLLATSARRIPVFLDAALPVGWRLHRPDGVGADGALGRIAFERGAVAWTHSAGISLLSRPNAVELFFLGRPGLGDPALNAIGDLVRAVVKDATYGLPLEFRVLFVDLPAPQHRLMVPPQRNWVALERGPFNLQRMERIAAAMLRGCLPTASATPAGDDAGWYPAALYPYGAHALAVAAGARGPLAWLDPWRILAREYLWERGQHASARAAALKGALVVRKLARTHVNATSLRLLAEPARNRSSLEFPLALAMQMNLQDPAFFAQARGPAVFLGADSPWRLPIMYAEPRLPRGAAGAADLRLMVSGETYAEVMGCTGCPAPGTIAQRTERIRSRSEPGRPMLALDAGDWLPFFLEETPSPEAFRERLGIVRLAAARAGLAAMVIGPGEVGHGRAVLAQLIAAADGTPLVSANLELEGGAAPKPFVLCRAGDLQVAVVGITDFPRRRYRLAWFEEVLEGVIVSEPVAAATAAARAARAAGADLVVVAGAIDPVHARLMAVAESDIDVVVSTAPGFDRPPQQAGKAFTAHDRSGWHGRVAVLYTAGQRGGFTRFDLRIGRPGGRAGVDDFRAVNETLNEKDPGDPQVQRREVAFAARFGRR